MEKSDDHQQKHQSLTMKLNNKENKTKAEEFLDKLLLPRNDPKETIELYSKWASTYEKDCKDMQYNGAEITANNFLEMNFEKDLNILDIGAGTGRIGEILTKNGYKNIDALDANDDMLKLLKEKNCYRNVIKSMVKPDIKLPIDDKTYDIVLLAGVFCPGHIDYHSLEEIIRITKSGGFICWSMGNPKNYADRDESYRDEAFERYISSLCDKCRWISVLGYPRVVPNYMDSLPGLFYAMQVV